MSHFITYKYSSLVEVSIINHKICHDGLKFYIKKTTKKKKKLSYKTRLNKYFRVKRELKLFFFNFFFYY